MLPEAWPSVLGLKIPAFPSCRTEGPEKKTMNSKSTEEKRKEKLIERENKIKFCMHRLNVMEIKSWLKFDCIVHVDEKIHMHTL